MTDQASTRADLRACAAVAGRILLAAGGGYGIAALATALLSLTLPLARAEAVTAATLLSFAVMIGVVVFVFAARSLLRAFVGVGAAGLVLGALLWIVMSDATGIAA
ncbi:iron transporter [Methylobacterium sp. ID0610]|uniref:iron transporter n=1 Tax=Methylobacterium carpenticola TaxID=3344827 RepID=UPI0036BADB45